MNQKHHKYDKRAIFRVCSEYKSFDGRSYDNVCGGYFSEDEVNSMLNGKKCGTKESEYGKLVIDCDVSNKDAIPKDLRERITRNAERFGNIKGTFVRKYLASSDKPRVDDFDHTGDYQLCIPFKSTDRSQLHRILSKDDEEVYSCYKISSQAAADFLQGSECKGTCKIENP